MATIPYEWQSLASPATTNSSHSGSSTSLGLQRSRVDPYHGVYPSAPHLRPIELPETGSPMMGFASPVSGSGSGSSRSRHTSLPAEGLGLEMCKQLFARLSQRFQQELIKLLPNFDF